MNFYSTEAKAGDLRGSSSESMFSFSSAVARPFTVTMGLIAVLAAIYYAFIAAPLYISQSTFTIHNQQPVMAAGAAGILAGLTGNTTGVSDIIAVQDFIQSPEIMHQLDKQYHLREAYSKFRPDLFNWMLPSSSDEAFLAFYRRMVVIRLVREAGIVEVDVKSFDRASATPIARTVLERTEAFVDGMTQRVRDETLRSASQELEGAQQQADQARVAVAGFRGAASSLDPKVSGSQVMGSEVALEAQASSARAELASALTYNRADAPAVQQLRAKVASLQAQAARLKAEQGAGGAKQVTTYESLVVLRDAAEAKLLAASTAFDAARASAQQREKYVVRIVNPSAPDRPTEPKRIIDFLTVMLFALTGYGIIALAVAGIRDHRGVS